MRRDGLTSREWKVICFLTAMSFVILRLRFIGETPIQDSIQYDRVRKKEPVGLTTGGEAKEKWIIQNPPAYTTHGPLLKTVTLPPEFDNFLNVTQPRREEEVPFFWNIPLSGGGTVKHIMAACLGLTLASDVGTRDGLGSENFLQVLWIENKKYVNVDISNRDGIDRAKSLGLIGSKLANVLVSGIVYEVASLSDAQPASIRMFTMMRHPVERSVSYYYWAKLDDEKWAKYSIRDFFLRPEFRGNWATRTLVNKMTGTLYLEDLDMAKHILKQKCLVGLLSHKAISLKRFEKYFGWSKFAGLPGSEECEEKSIFWGWQNKNDHPVVEEGSEEYKIIRARNEFDIELYDYANELFEEQGRMIELQEKSNESEEEKKSNESEEKSKTLPKTESIVKDVESVELVENEENDAEKETAKENIEAEESIDKSIEKVDE